MPDEQFRRSLLQAAGYRSAYHGEKSYKRRSDFSRRKRAARGSTSFAMKWSIRRRA